MYRLYFANYTIGFYHSVLEDLFQLNWNEALYTGSYTTATITTTPFHSSSAKVHESEKKFRRNTFRTTMTTGTTMELHNSKTRTKANIWRKENNNDKESERANGAKNKENNNGI